MARGRPAGATTKGKTDRTSIQIRVPTTEREAFEARALAVGLSLGEWARTLLRRDAGMWTGQEDSMETTKQIGLWLDTNSDPTSPMWIVSLDDVEADGDVSTRTLYTRDTRDEAERLAHAEAKKRGLKVVES